MLNLTRRRFLASSAAASATVATGTALAAVSSSTMVDMIAAHRRADAAWRFAAEQSDISNSPEARAVTWRLVKAEKQVFAKLCAQVPANEAEGRLRAGYFLDREYHDDFGEDEFLTLFLQSTAGRTGTVDVPAPQKAPQDTPADPMLELIENYRSAMAAYNASGDLPCEEDDALAAATYMPPYDRMMTDPPTPTTERGALEAVRLVLEEERDCGNQPELTIRMLTAALAYFDGRAS